MVSMYQKATLGRTLRVELLSIPGVLEHGMSLKAIGERGISCKLWHGEQYKLTSVIARKLGWDAGSQKGHSTVEAE